MRSNAFSFLTGITTALAAVTLLILPYEAGVFPGGAFSDAALGPLPIWAICSALAGLLFAICGGTAFGWGRDKA